MNKPNQIWQRAGKDLLDSLQSGPQGLTTKEAQQRLEKYGRRAAKNPDSGFSWNSLPTSW